MDCVTLSTRTFDSEEPSRAHSVVKCMRVLLGLLLAFVGVALVASPAAASCAPPAPVADNAGRAVAVVYGTVTASDRGAITLRVDRALRGQVGSPVRVLLGPSRVNIPGIAVATSIDYAATVGSDHVLYLIRGSDGELETNACNGSHAGPPNAAELTFFASSISTATSSPAPGTVTTSDKGRVADNLLVRHLVDNLLMWLVPVAGLLGAVILIALRQRAQRRHPRHLGG